MNPRVGIKETYDCLNRYEFQTEEQIYQSIREKRGLPRNQARGFWRTLIFSKEPSRLSLEVKLRYLVNNGFLAKEGQDVYRKTEEKCSADLTAMPPARFIA